jgi:hypothetical protein
MDTIGIRSTKNSKSYEDEGAFDLWEQLGLEVAPTQSVLDATEVTAEEGHVYTVEVLPLKFKDRLRFLLGKTEPKVQIVDHWDAVRAPNDELADLVTDNERRLARSWIIKPQANAATGSTPTPSEQGREAMKLVHEYERTFTPEFIAAVKALPKADELVVKLPREFSPKEKSDLRRKINLIMKGKPVSMKVEL